jgi:hypothetical protein
MGGAMHQRYLLTAVLLSLLGWAHAWGVDTQGRYQGRGLAQEPCKQFLRDRVRGLQEDYATWLSGFFSGINLTMPDTYAIEGLRGRENIDGGLAWLHDYCQRNPKRRFGDGAQALIQMLYPTRQTHAPPKQLPPPRRLRAN